MSEASVRHISTSCTIRILHMNIITRFLLGAAMVSLLSVALAAESLSAAIPNVKTDGEIRVLPRTRPDRQYQLYIGLPASYGKDPGKKYPVVYVTDGYWNFSTIRGIYWGLLYDKTLPEIIVVGIGYAGENLDYVSLRSSDLSPPLESRSAFEPGVFSGQADQFLHLIETVAIPLVEQEYRADPYHRVLVGGSLGGLFTLYALYANPTLFHGYVAASPSISTLWQYEEAFARSGKNIDAKVFVSFGGFEAPSYQNEMILFNQRLANRNYLKGGYQFHSIEGMRHCGAIAQGYIEGLQNICESFAPEHGISAEWAPPMAKDFYVIHFNPTDKLKAVALWTPAQQDVMHRHRRRLDDLVKQKKILVEGHTPDGSGQTFSSIGLNALDRKEAEQLAIADPAVVAGLMTFEVMCLSEKPVAR
jgi:hypothetical protein